MNRTICAAAALAIGACFAAPASAAMRDDVCLQNSQIRDFRPLNNNRALIVEDSRHRKFRVNMFGVCPDLKWKTAIAFRSFPPGSLLACVQRGDKVFSREFGFRRDVGNSCTVGSVERYTPAMEQSDNADRGPRYRR